MHKIVSAAVPASLLAGACGGHPGDIACDERQATPHVCVLYSQVSADQQPDIDATCTDAMGTVGTSCPTANRLGTCTSTAGGTPTTELYYSEGGTTADMAETACTSFGGTWTAQ